MKGNNTPKITTILIFGLTLILRAPFQPTASATPVTTPPPQLTISKVVAYGLDTANPTLAIEGVNFGTTPAVFIGVSGGTLAQLTVLSSSSNFISVQLT